MKKNEQPQKLTQVEIWQKVRTEYYLLQQQFLNEEEEHKQQGMWHTLQQEYYLLPTPPLTPPQPPTELQVELELEALALSRSYQYKYQYQYPYELLFFPVLFSFLAGGTVVGIIWYIQQRRQWRMIYSWYQSIEEMKCRIDEEIKARIVQSKSRIGELPSSKIWKVRWPWDKINRNTTSSSSSTSSSTASASVSVSSRQNKHGNHNDDDDKEIGKGPGNTTTNSTNATNTNTSSSSGGGVNVNINQEKSDLCIGEIFGLDVGGTLAKLVYFEKKPDDVDYEGIALRNGIGSLHNNRHNKTNKTKIRNNNHHHHQTQQQDKQKQQTKTVRSYSESCFTLDHQSINQHNKHNNTNSNDIESLKVMRERSLPDLNKFTKKIRITTSATTQNQKKTSKSSMAHVKKIREVMLGSGVTKDDGSHIFLKKGMINSEHHHQKSQSQQSSFFIDSIGRDNYRYHYCDSNIDTTNNNYNDDLSNSSLNKHYNSSMTMRRSKSMLDLSKTREHAQALDRFYNFAKTLDTQVSEGVKDHKLSFYARELGGEFHFLRFETRKMWHAMELIKSNNLHNNIREMGATGGGAHKYAQNWEQVLGITMKKQDELDSLVAGMQFVLTTVIGECYTFRPPHKSKQTQKQQQRSSSPSSSPSDTIPNSSNNSQRNTKKIISRTKSDSFIIEKEKKISFSSDESDSDLSGDTSSESDNDNTNDKKGNISNDWWWSRKVQRDSISYSSTYPYLVVTIGTGVSILRVDGPRKHERISGSTIGGGTYYGLIRLLTDIEDFDDVMRLAQRGDPTKVDMMVGDIYGENSDALEKIGLTSNVVASSFGKLVAKENPAEGVKQEDIARALLLMVTNNIGQVAYLNAKLYQTNRIYFIGNFLRQNKLSQRRLSFAIDFWSKGSMEALFLEHEGYFGALGSFLLSQNINQPD